MSITITWKNPGDDSITHYEIAYKDEHEYVYEPHDFLDPTKWTWNEIANSDADTTTYTIGGLTEETFYGFGLRAVNGDGTGEAYLLPPFIRTSRPPHVTKAIPPQTISTNSEWGNPGKGITRIDLRDYFDDVDTYTEYVDDRTGKRYHYLRFRVSSSDPQVVVAQKSSRYNDLILRGVPLDPATATATAEVTVTVCDEDYLKEDCSGLSVEQTVMVTVNAAPIVVAEIPDQAVGVGQTKTLDLDSVFEDPGGDMLTYEVFLIQEENVTYPLKNSQQDVARADINGSSLNITGLKKGELWVVASARDPYGPETESFVLTVTNEAPVGTGIADQMVSVGKTTTLDLDSVFEDPNGDMLTYEATSSDTAKATVEVEGSMLTIKGVSLGSSTEITVTATDPEGETASSTFTVTVVGNQKPTAKKIPVQTVLVTATHKDIDLSAYFSDRDNEDELRYTASSDNEGKATVTLTVRGNMLRITPKTVGTATITVTASDGNGGMVSDTFQVTATPALPGAPTGFTVEPGDRQVMLTWEDPTNRTITRYEYRQQDRGPYGEWMRIADSDASTTSHMVTGLTNGTPYTFQFRAVNVSGPGAASEEVTVTPKDALAEILNRVMLPEVARAMADQIVGAIGRRVAQARQATRTLEVGGQSTLADVVTTHGPALADGTVNLKGLLSDSAFVLPLQAQPGAGLSHLTLWGNGAYRNLGGEAGTLDWDGDLLSARLGVDARLGQEVLAGLAVAWQQSEMDYTQSALTRQGDYETTLTSIHPYLGWTAPDGGLELWATAGYGWGDLTITDADRQLSSDLTAQTLGAGGSSRLWATETTRLRLKGEALHTQMDIDGSATLAAQTVKARRVRLALEGSRTQALAGGAQVQSSLELGLRHDAGDGRTGTGAEVGGGLRYTNPARRLTLATQARVLLLHGGDYEDWGISGTLQLAPGADGQGLAVRVQPGWGQSASRVSALWAQDAVAGLRPNGTPAQEGRVDVQVGYGVAWAEALVTPYGTIGLTTGRTRVYGLGSRLTLGSGLQFNLEGTRQETVGAPVDHGIRLELGLVW